MENTQQMSNTEMALAQHPYIAICMSIFGWMFSFISSAVPVLQFMVLCASLVLTVMTIYSKAKEMKFRKPRKKNTDNSSSH